MQINPIELANKSKLIRDYRKEQPDILDYFDYKPLNDDQKRLKDLHNRTFNRHKLVKILEEMNQYWDAPQETLKQINRLGQDDSVVVIGGQQAGLLTGPMYTINKIISIIQLAHKKEKALNIPVIPVFWIAGEDHDYDEINHVNIYENGSLKKLTTKQQVTDNHSISDIEIDHKDTEDWLKNIFLSLQETKHTKKLYDSFRSILKQSKTFVDFFARTIFYLFQEEGLVLFDSAHPATRELESDFLTKIIKNQQPFARAVVSQLESLRQEGHSISIEAEFNDAHLFYHGDNNERILLKRVEDHWLGKNQEIQLSTKEMLGIAKDYPHRLSNNVVSRPIMQEYLFPTLAFVAGDGEISYWATLKKAFHLFEFRVPPVVPRLSLTFVNRKQQSILEDKMIPIDMAINEGVNIRKINWLHSQQNPPISTVVNQVKNGIEQIHEPLQRTAKSVSETVFQTAKQNLEIINRELDYLENKIKNEIEQKYQHELDKYDYLESTLHPNGVLQERVWNPVPFLNEHNNQFITRLCQMDLPFKYDHYVVCF